MVKIHRPWGTAKWVYEFSTTVLNSLNPWTKMMNLLLMIPLFIFKPWCKIKKMLMTNFQCNIFSTSMLLCIVKYFLFSFLGNSEEKNCSLEFGWKLFFLQIFKYFVLKFIYFLFLYISLYLLYFLFFTF